MTKQIFQYSLLLLLATNPPALRSQKPPVIHLNNPSFEDFPQPGKTVAGWFDCGFAGETPPDVQPGSFKVNRPAHQGITYLGLVVRDNNTWESVSQRLSTAILKGTTYRFSMYMCHSDSYVSPDRNTNRDVNFSTPVIVRVWGGSNYCGKEELLSESSPVDHTEWKEYKFEWTPKITHAYIMIEAFYKIPTLFPYNGNLLIDNASDIVPVVKEDKKPPVVAVVKLPVKTKPPVKTAAPSKPKPDTSTETPAVVASREQKTPVVKFNPTPPIKEGQIIKIEKLQFEATSAVIKDGSFGALDEAYQMLQNNPTVVVEIGGHTNDLPADDYCYKLSTDRAKAVADYLVNKGVDRMRVQYKGYGKLRPIADNRTPEGRKQNQRVEIKILSVNG